MNRYIEKHQERFLSELFTWLRIPSISADPHYRQDIDQAADYLKSRLQEAGLDRVELFPSAGHPIVYGEKLIDPSLPTILVYGHYDVQPADPVDHWTSPPSEPQIRDGNIFARGASDDKGQLYMHVKALELMHQTDGLPCNVKFLVEGEEEIGTDSLHQFVLANSNRLRADALLISDTSMLAADRPSLTVGFRGISYHEVTVTGADRDLHSGHYGGAVVNPINALCQMIANLHDESGRISIPDFYEHVSSLTPQERVEINQKSPSEQVFRQQIGLSVLNGESGYTVMERLTSRPALDVHGIWGGYTGEGAKTIIAATAHAKLSMRLVAHQTSADVSQKFQRYFTSLAPAGLTVVVTSFAGSEPMTVSTDSSAHKAASLALETTFGQSPVSVRSGGSLPVVALFKTVLSVDAVMLGFGLDSDAIHAPDEHFSVSRFLQGIETITCFYHNYRTLMSDHSGLTH